MWGLFLSLEDFLQKISDETKDIVSPDFDVEINDTKSVPNIDDTNITYENLDSKCKKCKTIETCVLYIDIRKSTELNLKHKPKTLAKLYTIFVRNMIRCAEYHGSYVRNIIGDRIMVVFDMDNCFKNAINTAILLNTVAEHVINNHFKNNEIVCGIGVDFGNMLVVKTGAIKQGKENQFYKSLVWLGKPANIASKLTDNANKTRSYSKKVVRVGLYYPNIKEWVWINKSYSEFLKNLEKTSSSTLKYNDEHFNSFYETTEFTSVSIPSILITDEVYQGFKKECPDDISLKNGWWKEVKLTIPEYDGIIYGGNIRFTAVDNIK